MHDLCYLEVRDKLDCFAALEVCFKKPLLEHINILDLLYELRDKGDEFKLLFICLGDELRISTRQEVTCLIHEKGALNWISIEGQRHI